MADIINLNKYRKERQRQEARAAAAENRAKHGRTKEQKALDRGTAEEMQRKLDGVRREEPPEGA